jgi:multicomponent Na+:H+ antiporter subunit G
MTVLDLATVGLSLVGVFFFAAGTAGLLRFPDTCTRLHAITKADTLGLGFVVLALVLQAGSLAAAAKLVLIWLLAMFASTNGCFLLGRWALGNESTERES